MVLAWFPDLLKHVHTVAQFKEWYQMPATRGNQLIELLGVFGGIGLVYRLVKELGKDGISLLTKIHAEMQSISERTRWLEALRAKYPNVDVVIDKLKRMNGESHHED